MASLNEIIRLRKAFWRQTKQLERSVDSAQEACQRKIARILARKQNVPTDEDLIEFIGLVKDVEKHLLALASHVGGGYAL